MNCLLTRSALALVALAALTAGRANAADKVRPTNDATKHVDAMQHARVSTIEDMKVRNAAGEDIGTIKDLVVDIHSGKVVYAALDFGGFLGVGDKLFAVPWHALTVRGTDKDQHLVLNITKERLKEAPGFNKSHWPDMANPNWSTDVDQFYGPVRTSAVTR